jgi:hypothetical protein
MLTFTCGTAPDASDLRLRTVLRFCVPALLLAVVLRAIVMFHMPYAFFISDTREFLRPAIAMVKDGENPFKEKSRTFLARILYAIPVIFDQPLLRWIPVFQHLLGLAMVVAVGILCALWINNWRIWIIPLTTIIAVHPTILWYEHMALPDSTLVVMVLLVSATGGLYYLSPTRLRLAAFAIALILAAGARQEGFLFIPFGVMLVALRHLRELKVAHWRLASIVAVCVLAYLGSRTTQGGQMLLTSTIHMAPDKLWLSSSFSEAIKELRDEFKPRWPAFPDQHNKSRKIITHRINEVLAAQNPGAKPDNAMNNRICTRIGSEIAVRNWYSLPAMAFNKFLATHREPPSPDFGPEWLHHKHLSILFGKPGEDLPKDNQYIKAYFGTDYKTRDECAAGLVANYRVMNPDLLSIFQHAFVRAAIGWALPARTVGIQTVPGLPLIYALGFVGLLLAAVSGNKAGLYRCLWILILAGVAFATFTTASLRSRYRLLYEPWWVIGLFCLLDSAVLFATNLVKATRGTPTVQTKP